MIRCFESFSRVSVVVDHLKTLKSIFIDFENEFQFPVSVYYKEISNFKGTVEGVSWFDYQRIDINGKCEVFSNTNYYAPYGYFLVSAYLPLNDRKKSQEHIDFSKSVYINKCISNLDKMNIEYDDLQAIIERDILSITFKLKSPIENDLSISAGDLEDLLIDYRDNDKNVICYFTHGDTPKGDNLSMWKIISIGENMEYFIKSLESRDLEFYHRTSYRKSTIDIVC